MGFFSLILALVALAFQRELRSGVDNMTPQTSQQIKQIVCGDQAGSVVKWKLKQFL